MKIEVIYKVVMAGVVHTISLYVRACVCERVYLSMCEQVYLLHLE